MKKEEYPINDGDSELGHENNFLAKKMIDVYKMFIRKEITREEYEKLGDQIIEQGRFATEYTTYEQMANGDMTYQDYLNSTKEG